MLKEVISALDSGTKDRVLVVQVNARDSLQVWKLIQKFKDQQNFLQAKLKAVGPQQSELDPRVSEVEKRMFQKKKTGLGGGNTGSLDDEAYLAAAKLK